MITRRENVLKALHETLQALTGKVVLRNASLPERIPETGLLILRDGVPGEPEETMSPHRYHYQHRAEVEAFARGSEGLDETFDALTAAVGAALAADRTLGGLCDWAEPGAPEPADLPVEGAATIRAAILIVTLHFTTADPLA
jgi:hypothetical protein